MSATSLLPVQPVATSLLPITTLRSHEGSHFMTQLSQNTEEGLWVTARQLAAQAGLEFTVPCAAIVRDFICAGVRNMEREDRFSESDTELANAHLAQLVEAMVLATQKLPSRDGARLAPVIREGAVVIAKRICPLWPFC